jgi:cell division protein FtsI/penicillin-binding protein 2
MITAYEALSQRYQSLKAEGKPTTDLNPLDIVDTVEQKGSDTYVGYSAQGHPIPRFYKGGRLPKSSSPNMGKMDLLRAIEMSSNPYFSLLAGDIIKSPSDLMAAARKFSYGMRTGIDLPGEISGKLPTDLETNKTGLYSTAIGQHTLVVTPLQTTVMLSALANGGKVLKPKIMLMTASDGLKGISINRSDTEIKNTLFLPDGIRKLLLDAMCRVVTRTYDESLRSLKKMYRHQPQAISDYIDLKKQMLGKTSTAESVEGINLDLNKGTNLYTHVWFGGIIYEEDVISKTGEQFIFRDSFGHPELVVVVYLRFGGYGKEASPIAAQVATKWREIKAKYKK